MLCLLIGDFSTHELPAAEQPNARRPNILFLYTDDQAPWALGLSGHPHAKTPHMDRLIREGAYLVNTFVVTPVCSPSRASLMSSRYGSELGITDWIHPRREPELGLSPDVVTWPEVLQAGGYRTGLIGKWHLGVPERYHPTKNGFDSFMGFLTGGSVPQDPVLEIDGREKKFSGYTPDILTDQAVQFIEQNAAEPFLLCVHYRAPHARWLPVADDDWAPYENLNPEIPNPDYPRLDVDRVKRMTREYLASVSSVDRNVGRLLKLLDDRKLTDDTIVIFTSDHGYNMGHNGIWHKGNGHWVLTEPPPASDNIPRGQRPNMYDHSLRIPTGIRWPGVIEPGTVIGRTIGKLDFYPTIVAMAGLDPPAGETIRGRSFLPLLKGESIEWDDDFYAEYSTHHQSTTHMRAYRTPEWKLIRDFLNPGRDELYHLKDDPAERNNLIDSADPQVQQVRADLEERIFNQMREIKDPVLALTATDAADGGHPLSAEQRTKLNQAFDAQIERFTKQIAAEPNIEGHYSRRGDAYFFRSKFPEAVADYEKMVELNPALETSHWRRGIAYFYAGQYQKAARQFEIYHTFDDVDRENGIWRYLSQVKAYDLETARAGLLKYKKDDREPFPAVYQLFAGTLTGDEILAQIASADIDDTEREKRLFYAHLYIGLNHAVLGKRLLAQRHLREAVANTWAPEAGFGPHYMWHVGRVHFEQGVGSRE